MLLSLKRFQLSLPKKILPYRAFSTIPNEIPNEVDTVIVGGGIIGSSIALDLSKKTNDYKILVLEQNTLTSGTTWHAAGLIRAMQHSEELTAMASYTRDLYYNLENNTNNEYPIGWHQTGALGICRGEEHFEQMLRSLPLLINANIPFQMYAHNNILDNNIYNIPIHPINEILNIHPFINPSDLDNISGAIHTPTDGIVNPADASMAIVKLAKKYGNGNTKFIENCGVNDIVMCSNNNKVTGVKTTTGHTIECKNIVLACGQWTRQIGKQININIPTAIVPHQYAVFDKIAGVDNTLPVIRDYMNKIYVKPEVGSFAVGTFESPHIDMPDEVSNRNKYNNIPCNASNELYNESSDKINIEQALNLIPELNNVGLKYCIHGPDAHSIDLNPILGRAPNTENVYIAAGFNSLGIQTGPGVGVVIADWILYNNPSFTFNQADFTSCDVQRFHPFYTNNNQLIEQRALECYAKEYGLHYPLEEWEAFSDCENDKEDCIRLSSLHDILKDNGALFTHFTPSGWKRPLYFNTDFIHNSNLNNILEYNNILSFNHNKCDYNKYVKQEHDACRNGVVLFDLSSFGKYIIQGNDSEQLLNYLTCSVINNYDGKVIYTNFLNANGGIISDFTIVPISLNTFYIVTAANAVTKDIHHIKHYAKELNLLDININDITNEYSVLALMGPESRKLLFNLCVSKEDLNNNNFPYGTMKYVDLKLKDDSGNEQIINVKILRVSFVGELGYEMHINSEHAPVLYNNLCDYGNMNRNEYNNGMGLVNAGYHAFLHSLRLEKGYLHYGHDISPSDTQLEAGLAFVSAKRIKNGETNFLGYDAIAKQKENGTKRRLISFKVLNNENVTLWGHEGIYRNNVYVGDITTGAIGYSTNNGQAIGMGYVNYIESEDKDKKGKITKSYIMDGEYEILVAGKRIQVEACWNTSLWDPKGIRMKDDDADKILK